MTNPTQPPRSAREQLLDQMARWGVFVDRASIEDADIVLDAHAHELAEQIEAEAKRRDERYRSSPSPLRKAHTDGMRRAVHMIDPQAQR